MIRPDELRTVEAFADLSDDDLRWLADHATAVELDTGELIMEQGSRVDEMYAVLEGEFRLARESGPPDDRWIVRGAGKISGMLPYSRMTHTPVAARTLAPTRLAAWSSATVETMLDRIPVLRARLAQVLMDRSREFARLDEQSQRLLSLGKLAAGLAHELNNPAAAIQRGIDELSGRRDALSDLAANSLSVDSGSDIVASLRAAAGSGAADLARLDPLARSDAQDAVRAWLEDQGHREPWLAADTFLAAGADVSVLESVLDEVATDARPAVLSWLEADLASRRIASEASEAARRISELIASTKAYANLDRGPEKRPIDTNEGVRSTVAMLMHKARQANVRLTHDLEEGLPAVLADAGEMNQVWTNLIDNALAVSPDGGTVDTLSRHENGAVVVRVIDEGPGIPEAIQHRIFEPFFTTKEVGDGTGLGLDIVRRIVYSHGGEVRVVSEPGRTCFEVRMPAAASASATTRD